MSIIGCRWWYAAHRPGTGWRLRSVFHDKWWDGPHLTAAAAPRRENSSGIHAFNARRLAAAAAGTFGGFPRNGLYPVLGEVALWGKVVEHELGFRSEHALVRRLWVPERITVKVRHPTRTSMEDVGGLGCLAHGDLRFQRSSERLGWCLAEKDKSFGGSDPEQAYRVPGPGMVAALARIYGVDVEYAPGVEW